MSIGELWRRIHYLLNRSRLERELQEEMAAHRAMKEPGEPGFGHALKLREESQDVWGWGWWDRLGQDVRFAGRMLRRAPMFSLTALTVLTLGVGINIAGFQVLNAVALRPLPVRDPDSLVKFERRHPQGVSSSFSYPAFRFYAEHNTVLATSLAVHSALVTLGDDTSRDVPVEFVSPHYLLELGALPSFGRLLDGSIDGAPDSEPVIVLSHTLWQGRFGSDPTIVGRTIRVNGRTVTVAGVATSSFVGISGRVPHAWMPIAQHPHAFPGSNMLTNERDSPVWFFARVTPGLSPSAVEDGLRATAATLRQRLPGASWEGEWPQAKPAGRFAAGFLSGKGMPAALVAAAFTTILLLASCTNLAVLILARGFSREREISIRLSVGATRRRIVRQLLTESALLSFLGTALGLGLSFAVTRAALSFWGAPDFLQPTLDLRVLLFCLGIAAAAAGLFGLAPALQAIRPKAPRTRTRGALVAAQVATGFTLLVVGGLLGRGLQRVITTPLGFEYAEHITINPGLHDNGFQAAVAQQYWTELDARLGALPGVAATARASWAPLGNSRWTSRSKNGSVAYLHHVDPSYFEVMRIPHLRGRNLARGERDTAVVSNSFARAVWPGEDPVGKVHDGRTIVGVVGNARTLAIGDPTATEFYMAMDDARAARAVLVIRTRTDPAVALQSIVQTVRSVDSKVMPSVGLLRDAWGERLEGPRQMAVVVSTLGILALFVAAIGLAGLLSFNVSQRAREIGIRMALGAQSRDVVWGVIRQFVLPIGCGLGIGLFFAWALSSALRRELFGLSPVDPASYAGAALLFSTVALLAAAGPLRRALKVDPIAALRCD
jgi:predicted permease